MYLQLLIDFCSSLCYFPTTQWTAGVPSIDQLTIRITTSLHRTGTPYIWIKDIFSFSRHLANLL